MARVDKTYVSDPSSAHADVRIQRTSRGKYIASVAVSFGGGRRVVVKQIGADDLPPATRASLISLMNKLHAAALSNTTGDDF